MKQNVPVVLIEQVERRPRRDAVVFSDLNHEAFVPGRRHRLTPWEHGTLLDGQGAVHHQVFAEASLHANALAIGARAERRVERKDAGESSGMKAPCSGSRNLLTMRWSRRRVLSAHGCLRSIRPRRLEPRGSPPARCQSPDGALVQPLRSSADDGRECSEVDRCAHRRRGGRPCPRSAGLRNRPRDR